MISKYPGHCFLCNEPTQAGIDQYDLQMKRSYHADCEENQPPGPDAYVLADSLGYRTISWEEILRVLEQ